MLNVFSLKSSSGEIGANQGKDHIESDKLSTVPKSGVGDSYSSEAADKPVFSYQVDSTSPRALLLPKSGSPEPESSEPESSESESSESEKVTADLISKVMTSSLKLTIIKNLEKVEKVSLPECSGEKEWLQNVADKNVNRFNMLMAWALTHEGACPVELCNMYGDENECDPEENLAWLGEHVPYFRCLLFKMNQADESEKLWEKLLWDHLEPYKPLMREIDTAVKEKGFEAAKKTYEEKLEIATSFVMYRMVLEDNIEQYEHEFPTVCRYIEPFLDEYCGVNASDFDYTDRNAEKMGNVRFELDEALFDDDCKVIRELEGRVKEQKNPAGVVYQEFRTILGIDSSSSTYSDEDDSDDELTDSQEDSSISDQEGDYEPSAKRQKTL
ncbi:hypothetical protein [Parendozoicomonas sp. Alg238-R29]|uniref:hypothetical protein n=1 Tax=Parendozoicomonas sp. Alg238-R29 TaxID=2993446 RepID=UPI00248D7806|nr:hypothetical protein [Parendozoicomonas sp. Alg238-R29]